MGTALAPLFSGSILYLVPDNRGIAIALCEKLVQAGISTEVTATPPSDASMILFLEGCSQFTADDGAIDINERFFRLVASHATFLSKPNGLLVSVQDTGGSFGLDASTHTLGWSAGLSSLVKTATLEWPEASLKAIDIDCGTAPLQQIADALYLELLCGGLETQIAIDTAGKRRRFIAKEEKVSKASSLSLAQGDVVVVSGGARGVTASCLLKLSEKIPLNIAILARTPLTVEPEETKNCLTEAEIKQVLYKKSVAEGIKLTLKELKAQTDQVLGGREARRTIAALEKNGCQVLYFSTDIKQLSSVEGALKQVRTKWGRIDGCIHAAGVLADKYIKDKSVEQFRLVFDTKVQGLKNLLQATQNDSLKLLCCFSSIVAFVGNVGQCDYAMANEICNQICQEEQRVRGEQCLVKSLLWGPWAGGMADAALQQHFEKMGVKPIPLEIGGEAFVTELTQKGHGVSVILGDEMTQWTEVMKTGEGKKRFTLWIHQSTYPFLCDHRIQNVPVVPIMLQTMWTCDLAEALTPGFECMACENSRIIKGLLLNNFATTGDLYYLEAFSASNGNSGNRLMDVTIIDQMGNKRFINSVELCPKGSNFPPPSVSLLSELQPYPFSAEEAYEDKSLFHGPLFQVLNKLEGYSKEGSAAIFSKSTQVGNTRDEWLTRLVLLDGGAQLSVLFHWQNAQQYLLPLRFEKTVFHNIFPKAQVVYCVIKIQSLSITQMKAELFYLDVDKRVLCSIIGSFFVSPTSTLKQRSHLYP